MTLTAWLKLGHIHLLNVHGKKASLHILTTALSIPITGKLGSIYQEKNTAIMVVDL